MKQQIKSCFLRVKPWLLTAGATNELKLLRLTTRACFLRCEMLYIRKNTWQLPDCFSSLEWRSPGLTLACLGLALNTQDVSKLLSLEEKKKLWTRLLIKSYRGCCSVYLALVRWLMLADLRKTLLSSRWGPLDHRSGRNVSAPPTTPDCLQLMTRSHHLVLRSSHVGKPHIVCVCCW